MESPFPRELFYDTQIVEMFWMEKKMNGPEFEVAFNSKYDIFNKKALEDITSCSSELTIKENINSGQKLIIDNLL
jgi:hypothetical protein